MSDVTVDADAIPDELKDRDQWMLWDKAAERKKPFTLNAADSLVPGSWTDPDDWQTFEAALEAVGSKPSVGLGYVFANANEDYPRGLYGGLDLDGCVDPDGYGSKDWLPSLQPFLERGAYIEESPSGEGLHIPVLGFEPPEWWSDAHFTEEEHEGVEAYGQKFFTFTGDNLRDVGDEVVETGGWLEDWLIEANKAVTGEDPTKEDPDGFEDVDDGGRANQEEFLDEDDVREAIDHIDPDVTYTLWRDIGFALKDFFRSSGKALNVFTEWSRRGTKWDREAKDQAERIIKDADPGGGRTIATVIHHAREAGWEMPIPSGSSSTGTEKYDTDELERAEAIIESGCESDDPAGQLEYQDGCYGIPWQYKDDEGNVTKSGVDPVCNFAMETLSFLTTEEDETHIVIRVHPAHPREEHYDVRVEPSVFNSSEQFRAEVVIGRTTWFDPSNREGVQTVSILRYLRETVGAQDAPHRTGTPHISLSPEREEFVTPYGSLTADGWSDNPEYEFYTKGGGDDEAGALAQKWAVRPEDGDEYDSDAVAAVCEYLPRIRKAGRGLPMLGWFYAAPLKPYIHDWEDEFPLLAPKGDTGTGKTSTLRQYMKAFGGDGEPFSASDTSFTIEKHLSESRGFPVWMDEYKPTEMDGHRLKRLHRRLKEVTKERDLSKGTPDLDEITLHICAPVILSGEQKVADVAVRRRAIITDLSQEATKDGTETKTAFGELTGTAYEDEAGEQVYPEGVDLTEHARGYYQWILGFDEDDLYEVWKDAREEVKRILRDFGVTVEESEQRGLQTVLFGIDLHQRFAKEHGLSEESLPSQSEILDAVDHVIGNIGKGGHRREHADEFLELLTLAATEEYLEPSVHHRVVDSRSYGKEVLAIHMPSSFTGVKKYIREFNLDDEFNVLQKNDYLDSFGNKADVDGSYVLDVNKRVRKLENGSKAVFFDPDRVAGKLGDEFNLDAFRPPEEQAETDIEGVEPVEALSRQGNPYTSVSVTVENWEKGPDGAFDYGGTVSDETGVIDLIDWEGQLDLDEECAYKLEKIQVNQYDGSLQLEAVPNVTEAIELEAGEGYTQPGDSDPDGETSQSGLEHHSSEDGTSQAAADGGSVEAESADDLESVKPRVVMLVRENEKEHPDGVPRKFIVDQLTDDGVAEHRVQNGIEGARRDGEITEPTSDKFLPGGR